MEVILSVLNLIVLLNFDIKVTPTASTSGSQIRINEIQLWNNTEIVLGTHIPDGIYNVGSLVEGQPNTFSASGIVDGSLNWYGTMDINESIIMDLGSAKAVTRYRWGVETAGRATRWKLEASDSVNGPWSMIDNRTNVDQNIYTGGQQNVWAAPGEYVGNSTDINSYFVINSGIEWYYLGILVYHLSIYKQELYIMILLLQLLIIEMAI